MTPPRDPKHLSPRLRALLEEIVARGCPEFLTVLSLPPLAIPKRIRYKIQQALADELLGSQSGDRDLEIDQLISYIWSQPLVDEHERGLPGEPMQ